MLKRFFIIVGIIGGVVFAPYLTARVVYHFFGKTNNQHPFMVHWGVGFLELAALAIAICIVWFVVIPAINYIITGDFEPIEF